MLDTIEAAGERGSEHQVEVRIRAGNAVFDTNGTLAVVDNANGARTVIHAPGGVQRRPRAFYIAFV